MFSSLTKHVELTFKVSTFQFIPPPPPPYLDDRVGG